MNELTNIRSQLAPSLEKLNAVIAESLASSNLLLNTINNKYLEHKGKQIRPLLTLLLTNLLGTPNDKTIYGCAALELLHNASLIHDDVVDNSDMRRNNETINKIWDNQIAVLVGDYFVSVALSKAVDTGDLKIVDSIGCLGRRLTVGELDQIYNAQTNVMDEDAYIKMIELKTASLFITCSEIACYSTSASKSDLERLSEFSRLLGICFQIKDDTFDYYPNTEDNLGKPVGTDLKEGKISLPLLHVILKDMNEGIRDKYDLCLKDNFSDDEIKTLLNYAREKGGIEYAEKYMENLFDKAVKLLDVYPDSNTKTNLIDLFRYVIERNH